MDEQLLAVGRNRPAEVVARLAPEAVGVDEVRDHLDVPLDIEVGVRLAPEVVGDRRDAVRLVDRVGDDGGEARVLPDERDVGPVQRRHDGDAEPLLGEDPPGEHGARRVGDRVVDVEHVEPLVLRHVHHLGREGERVGEVLEDGVRVHPHLVEEHVLRDGPEPERHAVRDEVDLVAPRGERLAEFGGDDAGAAVDGVAGDADFHRRRGCGAGDRAAGPPADRSSGRPP